MEQTKEIKILNEIFEKIPEVQAGINIWQNKFHEFDVFTHTKEYVRHLTTMTSDREIIVAGWLHDIGKPVTATIKKDDLGNIMEIEPGKICHEFENHELIGKEMVEKMDKDLFTNFNQERIAKLIECHYIPMKGIKELRKTKNFVDFVISFNKLDNQLSNLTVTKEEVLMMFIADKLAQGKSCSDQKELFLIKDMLLNKDRNNDDLLKIFELQRSVLTK